MLEEGNKLGEFFESATNDRIYVNGLNLHQIKSEFLLHYTGDLEMIGSMTIGEMEQRIKIRFRNVEDFGNHTNAIEVDYDSQIDIITRWLYELNTPQSKRVISAQYAWGRDFKQKIVKYKGNNCVIPTSNNCFIKCIKYLTSIDYTQEYLTFIRIEQSRSNVMTTAKIQTFCKKQTIKIGCYDWFRVWPRNIQERDIALCMYRTHCCSIWKTQGVSFNEAIEDIKLFFIFVFNVLSDKLVKIL